MATSVHLGVLRGGRVVPEQFRFARMYNLGFTVRDPTKMQAHLDEVAKAGVAVPKVEKPPRVIPYQRAGVAEFWTPRRWSGPWTDGSSRRRGTTFSIPGPW